MLILETQIESALLLNHRGRVGRGDDDCEVVAELDARGGVAMGEPGALHVTCFDEPLQPAARQRGKMAAEHPIEALTDIACCRLDTQAGAGVGIFHRR